MKGPLGGIVKKTLESERIFTSCRTAALRVSGSGSGTSISTPKEAEQGIQNAILAVAVSFTIAAVVAVPGSRVLGILGGCVSGVGVGGGVTSVTGVALALAFVLLPLALALAVTLAFPFSVIGVTGSVGSFVRLLWK
jgi:hypothetical protein